MKIQPINNNNLNKKVSHKAYFKPNSEFKRLYGLNEMLQKDLVSKFQQLPNHEVEIVDVVRQSTQNSKNFRYTLFNNVTYKTISLWAEDRFDILSNIMNFLIKDDEGQDSFFKLDEQNAKKYEALTNPKNVY